MPDEIFVELGISSLGLDKPFVLIRCVIGDVVENYFYTWDETRYSFCENKVVQRAFVSEVNGLMQLLSVPSSPSLNKPRLNMNYVHRKRLFCVMFLHPKTYFYLVPSPLLSSHWNHPLFRTRAGWFRSRRCRIQNLQLKSCKHLCITSSFWVFMPSLPTIGDLNMGLSHVAPTPASFRCSSLDVTPKCRGIVYFPQPFRKQPEINLPFKSPMPSPLESWNERG